MKIDPKKLKPLVLQLDEAKAAQANAQSRCDRLGSQKAELEEKLLQARLELDQARGVYRESRVAVLLDGAEEHRPAAPPSSSKVDALADDLDVVKSAISLAKAELDKTAGAVANVKGKLLKALAAEGAVIAEKAMAEFVRQTAEPFGCFMDILRQNKLDLPFDVLDRWTKTNVGLSRVPEYGGWKITTGGLTRGDPKQDPAEWFEELCDRARAS